MIELGYDKVMMSYVSSYTCGKTTLANKNHHKMAENNYTHNIR